MEPVSIVFNTIFLSIPARHIPYDPSTMTDFFNTYVNHLALHVQSNKSVGQKTLHHTLRLFDICHLGGVVGRLSYLKRCLQILLFSLPAVLSCLLIHYLLTFSALPHCPRAWLRLKLSVMTIHRNFNWGLSGEGRES